MVACGRPSPSLPMTIASRGSAISWALSIDTERSVRAMAAVRNPILLRLCNGPSIQVQGMENTAPIDTLTERRVKGSHDVRVSKAASMPRAEAERNIAPTLVESTTPSITTTRFAPPHTSSTVGGKGRRMAHSTPRVSTYPVSVARSSRLPVYTGMLGQRLIISAASPSTCLSSQSSDKGS